LFFLCFRGVDQETAQRKNIFINDHKGPAIAMGAKRATWLGSWIGRGPKVIIGQGAGQRHHGDDGDRSAAQIGDWPERICTSEFRVGNPHKKQAALVKKSKRSFS